MKVLANLVVAALCFCSPAAVDASTVFIGQFSVADGPYWETNPTVYSAREAAAFLFGGSYTDYAISTIANTVDPSTINHLAYVDGWGDSQYLANPTSEDFKLDNGNPGYNDPASQGQSYSAYVRDHSLPGMYVNYVWRLDANPATPLPAAVYPAAALLLVFPVAATLRKRRNVQL